MINDGSNSAPRRLREAPPRSPPTVGRHIYIYIYICIIYIYIYIYRRPAVRALASGPAGLRPPNDNNNNDNNNNTDTNLQV